VSLRLRLTLLNSLILLLVGGALVAAVYAILVQGLQRQIDDSLREQARLYGADVSAWFYRETRRLPGPQFAPGQPRPQPGGLGGPGGAFGPPPGAGPSPEAGSLGPPELVVPIFRRFAGTSTFVQVANGNGQVEARSENLGADTLPLPPEALVAAMQGEAWIGDVNVEGQRLRAIVTPLRFTRVPGEPPLALVLQVAQPLGALEDTLGALQATVLLVGAAGVLVAVVAGWVLARTALHPIDRFAATADAIGAARDFGRRVPVADERPDEIGRLGMAFNRMLDELQAAHEQVATALVAQRRFVADASHELRTPLATIRGNVDLLRQMIADLGGGDSQETAILDDVSVEAERMSRLVADLLLLAQADAGQHLTLRPVDVSQVASDAARTARLFRDDVLVEAASLPGDLWVSGNADRLRQVVMILLDNAVKHSPSGGRVTLTARRAPHNGVDSVAIQVADQGPGILLAEQARIFERFYRAPGSRSGEGTGLGLAIGRWIAEEHRGSIELASEPGAGATFTVWLPASEPFVEPSPQPAMGPSHLHAPPVASPASGVGDLPPATTSQDGDDRAAPAASHAHNAAHDEIKEPVVTGGLPLARARERDVGAGPERACEPKDVRAAQRPGGEG
jgi:signal transduction histidine kinase